MSSTNVDAHHKKRLALAYCIVLFSCAFYWARGHHAERILLHANDFKTIYGAARCLVAGGDPYDSKQALKAYLDGGGAANETWPPFRKHWLHDVGVNVAALSQAGATNDPGPMNPGAFNLLGLQILLRLIGNGPHFYNTAACAITLLVILAWSVLVRRSSVLFQPLQPAGGDAGRHVCFNIKR